MKPELNKTRGFSDYLLSESGKGTTLAMVFCLAALVVYVRIVRVHFAASVPAIIDTVTFVTLIIVSIFTICCAVHMLLIGDPSSREFRRAVKRRAEELTALTKDAACRLKTLERDCCVTAASLSSRSFSLLNNARRLVTALEHRMQQVELYLQSPTMKNLTTAFNLMIEPLDPNDDCCDRLILGELLDPIESHDIVPTLEGIFRETANEIRRITQTYQAHGRNDFDSAPDFLSEVEEPLRTRRATIH